MGALTLLAACNPALNWREVRFDGLATRVLLPCKPDRAERAVFEIAQRTERGGAEAVDRVADFKLGLAEEFAVRLAGE